MTDWEIYYKKHSNRKPRERLLKAIDFCVEKDVALDLGSGNLIEAKALLRRGFKKVIAVDNSPQALPFAKNFKSKKLEFQPTSFQKFKFPKKYFNLVSAQYALPFYGKRNFDSFIKKIINSIKSGGIFVGQFFGVRDEGNTSSSKLMFNTKKEVVSFLSDFKMLELIEEEKNQKNVSGKLKKWHVFHFIAKKN